MREYGQIQCAFWQSDDATTCTDAGKLLAAYLMTGPHSNGVGCYRCPDGYVMADLGWDGERVSEGFAELFRNGFAYRFEGVVCMPRFVKWNPISNGNVAKARMKEFTSLPKGRAKAIAARGLLDYGAFLDKEALTYLETVCQTVTETVCQTEPNPEKTQPRENQDPLLSTATPSTDLLGKAEKAEQPKNGTMTEKIERLHVVGSEAIAAYNRILAKPNGLLRAVHPTVGRQKRIDEVKRCVKVAREICQDQFQDSHITPEFWDQYFTACSEDGFTSGAGPYTGAHANWRPDFEFLTRPAQMLKVFEKATDAEGES